MIRVTRSRGGPCRRPPPGRAAPAPLADAAVGRSLDFSFGPLDEDGVRSAFAPADHERLTRLRARYDPHGLLHADHRVPAAG